MRFTIAASLAASLLMVSPASAGFVSNKSDWNRLADKTGYAMGMFDGLAVSTPDSAVDSSFFYGWNRCAIDNRLTSEEFVEMVEQGYAADVANWSLPPLSLMLKGLNRLCAVQINEERAKLGLPDLPPPESRP